MNPVFGIDISADDIIENLSFFDSWEERYKYIIDLGKELPPMADELKSEVNLVRGCQSQVWLVPEQQDELFIFKVDSDAHIVKGLLAVVLVAFNGRSAQAILAVDIERYFTALDLVRHLSPSRGNGLRAMVKKIQDIATARLAV
ncbi:SufE family protein [Reinekea forsetii]|uniref:Sulfur acceptor protein SufE for iron-sulfur cluster assembly n=1 Tax=Reinekea forsetii TaxID=1336806 RepID=A0A2K8KR37_9GAMM|nr:SufE family protein [Reinekea forsetii]ATX77187.1 sulfur acceptor protein SufE for iron-sulfur cluster assembly [Reinekea forsetii]